MIENLNIHGHTATWTIDKGRVNAFGENEIEELQDIESLCVSQKIRLLCLESRKVSPRNYPIFCAGANLKERQTWSIEKKLSHLKKQREIVHDLRRLPCIVSCFVDGKAIGLGVELCLAADVVFASTKASFCLPEMSLGIIPGAGGYTWAQHWATHGEESVKWMHSGETIRRDRARYLGIIRTLNGIGMTEDSLYVAPDEYDHAKSNLSATLAPMSITDIQKLKSRQWENIPFERLFAEEQERYHRALLNNNRS